MNELVAELNGKPGVPRLAFTMKEAAQSIGVSYITMHRLIKRGKIKASDALRTKIIPASELEKFLRV
jgi:excisionase family DNA binding protein